MVEFDVGDRKGEEAIKYSWELGERAASECTHLMRANRGFGSTGTL